MHVVQVDLQQQGDMQSICIHSTFHCGKFLNTMLYIYFEDTLFISFVSTVCLNRTMTFRSTLNSSDKTNAFRTFAFCCFATATLITIKQAAHFICFTIILFCFGRACCIQHLFQYQLHSFLTMWICHLPQSSLNLTFEDLIRFVYTLSHLEVVQVQQIVEKVIEPRQIKKFN